MELLPIERDAINGEMLIGYFAVIAAWVGEKDLAIEQINAAVPLPGAATITSYGVLKLRPSGTASRRSALRRNRRLARA